MQQLTRHPIDVLMRRTYDTSPAHLLIIAPTGRELGGTRANRMAGYGTAEIGVGRIAAGNLKELLVIRAPRVLLSVGYGGALTPGLSTGDVVVSRNAATIGAPNKRVPLDYTYSDGVFEALTAAGIRTSYGDVLTVPEPLLSGNEKRMRGLQSQATVVDMESYFIAQEARQAGVPAVIIRVVLDEMDHDLPELVAAITADGGQNEWRHALRAMVQKPMNAGALVPLAVRSRKASAAIGSAVQAAIPVLTKDAPLRAAYR